MKKRVALWLVIGLLMLTALAGLVPSSPVYLPKMLSPGGPFAHYHDGHFPGYWVEALKSPDADLRHRAIFNLGAIGPDSGEGVPELSTIMLEDPDPATRNEAALALSKMTPTSREAVPALAKALDDDEGFVRMNAAIALSRLRKDARSAVPALIKALKEERNLTNLRAFHVTIQEMVALALGRASAGSDEAVPALTEALENSRQSSGRRAAASALGEVGSEARSALPQLRDHLKDADLDVREAVKEALHKIEAETPAAP